jgi:hypothetical protein
MKNSSQVSWYPGRDASCTGRLLNTARAVGVGCRASLEYSQGSWCRVPGVSRTQPGQLVSGTGRLSNTARAVGVGYRASVELNRLSWLSFIPFFLFCENEAGSWSSIRNIKRLNFSFTCCTPVWHKGPATRWQWHCQAQKTTELWR